MANLIVLQDGTPAVVAPVNSNFDALNVEVRSVDRGGTGQSSFTSGALLVGNGTSPIATVVGAPGQILVIPSGGGNPDFIDMVPLPATLTLNGVVLGQGTAPVIATAAGTANQVFQVPEAGGAPAFRTFQSGYYNFLVNGGFEDWSRWPNPYGWTGSAGAVTRGAGLTGVSALGLTRSGADVSASQDILLFYPHPGVYQGIAFSFGCYVYATQPNQAYIDIFTNLGSVVASPVHPGDSQWHWLSCSGVIPGPGVTTVQARCIAANNNGTAVFDLAALVQGTSGNTIHEGVYPSPPLIQTGHFNYLYNSDFEIWGAGTTAKPTGWSASTGTTLGTIGKAALAGQYISGTGSVVVTLTGSQNESVFQDFAVIYPPATQYGGRQMTAGAWMWSSVANGLTLTLRDNVGGTNTIHPGDSQWHWLTTTYTMSATPTVAVFSMTANGPGSYYMDLATVVDGPYLPAPVVSGWRGRKGILQFSSGTTGMPAATASYYGLAFNFTTTGSATFVTSPYRGVLRNFRATANGPLAATSGARLLVDGADTSLVGAFTVAGGFMTPLISGIDVEVGTGHQLVIRTSPDLLTAETASVEIEEIPAGLP